MSKHRKDEGGIEEGPHGFRILPSRAARQDAEDRYSKIERDTEAPTGGKHAAPPDDVEGFRPGRR